MDESDLKRAYDALKGKNALYTTLFRYAEGDQPLIYSTKRLQEAFSKIDARFSQNWCSVVIDALAERLTIKGWDAQNDEANTALDDLWNRLHIDIEAQDAHWAALVTHEAFLIAWPDEAGEVEVYYNDPRLCHMFYQSDNPRKKEFAAKWFTGDDGTWQMTLYYPDRLEYYQGGKKDLPTSYKGFKFDRSEANPYGAIPVFHLRTSRRGYGELTNVRTLQDAVNKLLADMMVAAEFGAFKQRWIISNSDTSDLKNAPNEIWSIPAGDGVGQSASVGQFDATDLNVYLNAIDKLATSIAIISRTPKHYFYSQGGDPSGEALIAMEAPLDKKAEKRQVLFGATWRELGAFLLKLQGVSIEESDIIPVWEPSASVQPLTEAQVVQIETGAGIPLVTSLRRRGWDEKEIKRMQDDKEEEMNEQYPADWNPEAQAQATGQAAPQNAGGAGQTQPNNPGR